ncbi:type 2 lantipeptide synthetase LanM, partial [Nonomuraea sp. MG754425]|uniref:type 2 lanthipeptide synthetase LanM family protein n=1 Tax=Nonomuraea sp. MG754425 TaxID=2570319 RepID=UPI001F211144
GWEAGFGVVVAPFVRAAVDRLTAAAEAEGLGGQLVGLAARVLVLELNVQRVRGELRGGTPQERFGSFVARFATRNGLTDLLSEYVVLARLLARSSELAVESRLEFLRRLGRDRDEIVRLMFGGTDPGRVVEVVTGAGDHHREGRSVGLLRFADGRRLVYKPRPVAVHAHFDRALRWLNARVPGLGLRGLAVLDRTGYGWVEHVAPGPCADVAGVRRCYRRQGALLALLHTLDGVDLHYENLVAAGDQPVPVDLETLFHPRLRGPAGDDPADAALDASVARVGLLPAVVPAVVPGERGGVLDLSGMGGDAGQPFEVAGWAGAGGDEMRLTRARASLPGSGNRPGAVAAPEADPADFAEEVVAGFTQAYEAIAAGRGDLLAGGVLAAFADDEIRVVARPTRTYGILLRESTHPDAMRDALDRDRVLDSLWAASAADPARRLLVPAETADLWDGDIPLFAGRPGAREVWTSRGARIAGVLDGESFPSVVANLRAMNERDLAQQNWIIHASLATRPSTLGTTSPTHTRPAARRAGSPAQEPGSGIAVHVERMVAAAREIAGRIAAHAHHGPRTVNWLGLEPVGETRWTVGPLKNDLYGGLPGVALFLGQVAGVTGEQRYADLARRAMAWVPAFAEHLTGRPGPLPSGRAGTPGCGAFSGTAGLVYALTHLARDLDAPDLLDHVGPLIGVLMEEVAADEVLDVVGGAAGCLAVLLAVHDATGLPLALRGARACADRLVATARPQRAGVAWPGALSVVPLTGFSHGTSGIGWALLRFAAATGEHRYAKTGLAAFAYERALFDPLIGNWPDFRDRPDARAAAGDRPPPMQAWCHGAPGIGLARADLLHEHPCLAHDLDVALASFLAAPPGGTGHSLCHGELGNLLFLAASVAAGRDDLAPVLGHRAGALLDELAAGPRCGTPAGVPTPGLMAGLAGIGHGLLRLARPDRVP